MKPFGWVIWFSSFFLWLGSPLIALNLNEREEFGYLLATTDECELWWAEGTYKIGEKYEPPSEKRAWIEISAARREYEPFQLVIYAKTDLKEISLRLDNLKNAKGESISKKNIQINLVDYLYVTIPTDLVDSVGAWPNTQATIDAISKIAEATESVGWWPDPLPPYINPFDVEAGNNQPIWITVYVPEETVAGIYEGEIEITPASAKSSRVRLRVRVFDFVLPRITHTKTAYGVGVNKDFLGLDSDEDIEKVYDLYLQNFARHRVSPYNPMAYHPIKWDLKVWESSSTVEFDFEDFDKAAHKYLDEYGFNAFNFGGIPKEMAGYAQFTPRFNELFAQIYGGITEHLQEKGWLEKAYCYWIDEPAKEKYEFVKEGMELLKKSCPVLRRLLTVDKEPAPAPTFYGYVDLWVPHFPRYDEKRAKERQELGEEVWWYVCCGPKSPYPNNFIDHAAIEQRIRFWMMEKYGVTGDLYWATTCYGYKYPEWTGCPGIINPWVDPMGYPSKPGYWGNGDGRMLYPAVREPSKEPVVAGPVNSIRWELIREGLEDREYFWLLKQEIARLETAGDPRLGKYINRGREALDSVNLLVESLNRFERDPVCLYEAREEIARTIEQLRKL